MMLELGLRLAPKHRGVKFILAGDRDRNGLQRKAFRYQISLAGINSRFRVLPFVDQPEDLYRESSIFVLPAEIVFSNFSLLEAMERGIAPVVASVDGAEQIIKHDISGLIVDLNKDSFVAAIESLLTDPERLEKLCAGARVRIREKFDLEKGIEKVLSAYNNRVW
jgi:glycosyltransferase involved in cell wall biosynthesis